MSLKKGKETDEEPDFSRFFHPHPMDSERGAVARPLITSDKNDPAKTRLVNGYVMSVVDDLGEWTDRSPPFKCLKEECEFTTENESEFVDHRWAHNYRIDMISEQGESRREYERVASAPSSLAKYEEVAEKLKEGARR